MTCAIYALMVFAAVVLFMPTTDGEYIRNAPLLITILAAVAVYYIVKLVKFAAFAGGLKKQLIAAGMQIKQSRLSYNQGAIIAESEAEVYKLCLIRCKKKYYRYHFHDEENIEFFKTTASAVRSGNSASAKLVTGTASTQSAGRQKLAKIDYQSDKQIIRFIVIDRFPSAVTEALKREGLGNGDHICNSGVLLFNKEGFERFLSE